MLNECESAFYNKINIKTKKRKEFNNDKIERYVEMLRKEKLGENVEKTPEFYYIRRKFDVKKYKGKWILINRKKDIEEDFHIPVIHKEELYDTIRTAHINCLHGGIKKTFNKCKSLGANIKLFHVKVFISLCQTCNELKAKKKIHTTTIGKSVTSKEFGERGQVDIIDIQKIINHYNIKDTRFRFVLNYQDNKTKFCFLKGLKNKKANSIITALDEIFGIIGAPKILQSDNGGEFVNKTIDKYLYETWPTIKRIKGRPYHPQSQGSVERANGDVKEMLRRYFSSNLMASPIQALNHVQYNKNTSYNRSIKTSPFESVFGRQPPTNISFENVFSSIKENYQEILDIDEKS